MRRGVRGPRHRIPEERSEIRVSGRRPIRKTLHRRIAKRGMLSR